MIIDTFMFFNELDVLEARLQTLYNKVDKFVLVEASETHLGKKKPFFFEENKQRYSKYLDKIIHKKIELKELPGWPRENENRYIISSFLKELDLQDDDIILNSDCDEIPNLNAENKIEIKKHPYCFLNQLYFVHYANLFSGKAVTGTCAIKYDVLKQLNNRYPGVVLQVLRNSKDFGIIVENGGWHYSYFGGAKTASEKSRAIAEGKTDGADRTQEHYEKLISDSIKNKTSVYSARKLTLFDKKQKQAYIDYTTARNGGWSDASGIWDIQPETDLTEISGLFYDFK